MRARLLALALAAPALAACGASTGTEATSTVETPRTTTSTPNARATTVTVFHVRNGVLRPSLLRVTGRGFAVAALRELALPPAITIAGGVARVETPELSEERRAELVYTLTQFSSIESVSINGGEPRTRADYEVYAPPILVESPAPATSVGESFTVSGTASVFEAALVVQVVRDGRVLVKQTVTASEGAPGRGTFEARLHATPGAATVEAFSASAVDGTPQHEVAVPIIVKP